MKEYWTSVASLLGVFAFCQTILQTVFPAELRYASAKLFNRIFHCFSSYCYFDITEIDSVNTNELYNAVQLYLSSSVSLTGNRLNLTCAVNSSGFTSGLANNDSIVDTFNNYALLQVLGDRKGINWFGNFSAPLNEALIHVSLDLSGRPHLSYNLDIPTQRVG